MNIMSRSRIFIFFPSVLQTDFAFGRIYTTTPLQSSRIATDYSRMDLIRVEPLTV